MTTAPASTLTLYGYFRSSAAYRVRIALNLKGLDCQHIPVHLTRGGGEQLQPDFTRINPMQAVPVLRDGELQLSQSLAILEYLEERYPGVPLLPADLGLRAQARMLALTIACDIHPVNNLRIVNHLTAHFGLDAAGRQAWMQHWIEAGFAALDAQLAPSGPAGRFCVGDTPTLADCCLVPQVFNARRFAVDIGRYPNIDRITAECERLPAFERARPSQQADAE